MPGTSLVAELREEPASGPDEPDGGHGDFSAERAAASLGGFQRGTLKARGREADEETDGTDDRSARRPLTKDTP
ncbi:Signal transduction histidine-protein kinase/phosphatase MprB OS=Streptomyces fumanus OX=67302 GN=GCM10018772_39850 PE=4 SV=1 [Streptomyces fumanus]